MQSSVRSMAAHTRDGCMCALFLPVFCLQHLKTPQTPTKPSQEKIPHPLRMKTNVASRAIHACQAPAKQTNPPLVRHSPEAPKIPTCKAQPRLWLPLPLQKPLRTTAPQPHKCTPHTPTPQNNQTTNNKPLQPQSAPRLFKEGEQTARQPQNKQQTAPSRPKPSTASSRLTARLQAQVGCGSDE